MGILDSGALGPFRKKLGAAIGRRHMGQDLVLPLYHKTNKKASLSQLSQRERFSLLTAFLSRVALFVNPGFKAYAKKKSAINAAVSYNFNHAFVADGDGLELNYPKIVISRGRTTSPNRLELSNQANIIQFNWAEEPQSRYCQATDRGSFLAYQPATNSFKFHMNVVERHSQSFQMAMNVESGGNTVHCWVVFASADGKTPGDSKYAGTVIY